ncbi:DUF371 domain-containing protein [Candidatus Woesearchaeota archaeon]|nr:DUF371 domain-containing protein [Candidatus Woesearchaeota archaeon]
MNSVYHFTAHGHPNLRAMHPTTLEFTKEEHLTLRGDCIVGVRADFDSQSLQKLFAGAQPLIITLTVGSVQEVVHATYNPSFSHNSEMVIRLSTFADARTFAINADKAAKWLSRKMVEKLSKGADMEITIAASP